MHIQAYSNFFKKCQSMSCITGTLSILCKSHFLSVFFSPLNFRFAPPGRHFLPIFVSVLFNICKNNKQRVKFRPKVSPKSGFILSDGFYQLSQLVRSPYLPMRIYLKKSFIVDSAK